MSYQLPDEWVRSETTTQFFGQLATSPRSLLLLDYDGTLAPFTPDRLNARMYPGVKERLEQIASAPKTQIAFISGRKAQELRALLSMPQPVEIWGSHGREHLSSDGTYELEQLTPSEEAALQSLRAGLEEDYGADVIELKPNSVAVHWRLPEPDARLKAEAIRERMELLFRKLPRLTQDEGTVELLSFDGGLEVRAGSIDKGHAVRNILRRFPEDTPVAFLGDDTTDEDAFRELTERGLAVLVRKEPRETSAQLWLSPPEDLLHFLDAWVEAVRPER